MIQIDWNTFITNTLTGIVTAVVAYLIINHMYRRRKRK